MRNQFYDLFLLTATTKSIISLLLHDYSFAINERNFRFNIFFEEYDVFDSFFLMVQLIYSLQGFTTEREIKPKCRLLIARMV